MKTAMPKKSRARSNINVGRWSAYALAGAATAVAASNDADATIYYSGPVNAQLTFANPRFQLQTLGTHPSFSTIIHLPGTHDLGFLSNVPRIGHSSFGIAQIADLEPRLHEKVVGTIANGYPYASKLAAGVNIPAIATSKFKPDHLYLASGYSSVNGKWKTPGTGFLAFEFQRTGDGEQYGWVRITMGSAPQYPFTVVDYAFGSPGQAIVTGEEVAPSPEPATLGLLAVGAAGVLAMRTGRRHKAVA